MQDESIPDDLAVAAVFRYSAFYDLLADAAFQHRHAKEATDSYIMSRFARASVLASALSVECAANCLLASIELSKSLRTELDRLAPIAKIEAYLKIRAVDGFDRGRLEVQQVVELVKARNEYVHPKASAIPATVNKPQDGGRDWVLPFDLDGEHWSQLGIPKRAMFWSAASALSAIGAIASFFSYLFSTLLKATPDQLHDILPSRLEMGDVQILAVFDEIRSELQVSASHGVDFSFFGIFHEPVASPSKA